VFISYRSADRIWSLERTPTDTYSGINAASKSAMFGDMKRARDLATRVL
jgi:hypothetical protein